MVRHEQYYVYDVTLQVSVAFQAGGNEGWVLSWSTSNTIAFCIALFSCIFVWITCLDMNDVIIQV